MAVQRAKVPALGFGQAGWREAGPDPRTHPDYYHNIVGRRFLAWCVDIAIISFLMGGAFLVLVLTKIISFGLLVLPVSLGFLAVPLIYYTGFLGGKRAATPGMRILNIELRSWTGTRPSHFQALLRTLLHYATVTFLSPLVLVVVLCNDRRRGVHDYLSGTVLVNRPASRADATGGPPARA